MAPLAYFGIESRALTIAVDIVILCAAVLYLSMIYWTVVDARRRIADPLLVGCALVVSLFPIIGPIVYLILRPPEFLVDVHQRELEVHAAEVRLQELDRAVCPYCSYQVERDFVRCPNCLQKLKERCAGCGRPLEHAWPICPYCETQVPGAIERRSTLLEDSPVTRSGQLPTANEATQTIPSTQLFDVERRDR